MESLVLVYLKYPEKGRVKTRLAREVGDAEAVRIYRLLVGRVLGVLGELQESTIRILYHPPEKGREVEGWVRGLLESPGDRRPSGLDFRPQAEGDLGDRLHRGFEEAFGEGFGPVAAVGTDCADLEPGTFARTWELLGTKDVVLGPTLDGGYYLVGMRSPQPALFRAIPWSSGETLAETLRSAERARLKVALLAPLRDVDRAADWEAVKRNEKGEGKMEKGG